MKFATALCLITIFVSAYGLANWDGEWELTPGAKADLAKCCFPNTPFKIAQDKKKVSVTGTWAESDACKTAGLATKAIESPENSVPKGTTLKLSFTLADQATPVKATLDKGGKDVTFVLDGQRGCIATIAQKKAETIPETKPETKDTKSAITVDWSGNWAIKVDDGVSEDTCCFPNSPVNVVQTGEKATASGHWADSKACKAVGLDSSKAWKSADNVVGDNTNLGLSFVIADGTEPVTATLVKSDDTAKYQNVKQPECKATFKLIPKITVDWNGKWNVKKDTGVDVNKCCFPDSVTLKQTDNKFDMTGVWSKSSACGKLKLTDKTPINAVGNDIHDNGHLQMSFKVEGHTEVPEGTLTKDGNTAHYVSKTDETCKATFTLDAPVAENPFLNHFVLRTAEESLEKACCFPANINIGENKKTHQMYIQGLYDDTAVCKTYGRNGGKYVGTATLNDDKSAVTLHVSEKEEGKTPVEVYTATLTKKADGKLEYSANSGKDGKDTTITCKTEVVIKEKLPPKPSDPKQPTPQNPDHTAKGPTHADPKHHEDKAHGEGKPHVEGEGKPADAGETKPAGEGEGKPKHDDGKKEPSKWNHWYTVLIIAIILIIAVVIYFVIRKQQAAKLSESLKGAQQESLLAH